MNADTGDGQAADSTPPPTTTGVIASRHEFVNAVHAAVADALTQGSRQMLWVDRDFADWPLDDVALLDTLTQWLRLPQRRLQLLAEQFDDLSRRSSRFVAWYRWRSHAVQAHSASEADAAGLPCLLLTEGAGLVQLLDKPHWRGRISTDASDIRQWRDRLVPAWQQSQPSFPPTTLGL
ncbi:MAG: hypothetical protein ABIR94_04785 [Rubrivivax sp.]